MDMSTATLENFASRMSELRKKLRISQPKLAQKVGTNANVIGRYERAEATPSVDAAKRIAEALNATLDYMTSDSSNVDPVREKAFGERCRVAASLPDEDQERIIELMDILIRDARARTAYG
jgi:transcriptional regulator with XRE-family HTH domain